MKGKVAASRLATLLMFGFITACGPRMTTVTDYIPPVTDSGMRCVVAANQGRTACELGNSKAIEQCSERAAIDADQAFDHAQKTYTKNLEQYIVADEVYEHKLHNFKEQKRLLLHDGELAYIKCSEDVKMKNIEQFPECKKFLKKAKKRVENLYPPHSPVKPYPPNRNTIFNNFVSQCNNQMINCQQAYNQSYRSCGGTITNRQVCVSNCD
ncbi:MAG: hypothetical protein GY829_05070 [Gammaproteobacteria bacterium]|nr:hypothetical protein [Gammaproteobacteria bacterium]